MEAFFRRQQVGDAAGREVKDAGFLELALMASTDVYWTFGPDVLRLFVLSVEDAEDARGPVVVDAAAGAPVGRRRRW